MKIPNNHMMIPMTVRMTTVRNRAGNGLGAMNFRDLIAITGEKNNKGKEG